MGLVINTADPYSVAVGAYYIQKRGIPPEQVLRVELPVQTRLSVAEFGALYAQIRDFMGPQVQALALAWSQPFAVGCNSITSALTNQTLALLQLAQHPAIYRFGLAPLDVACIAQCGKCQGTD